MKITPIQTGKIRGGGPHLLDELEYYILDMEIPEGSILAITSKIVSICEDRVTEVDETGKLQLIYDNADQVARVASKYGFHYTITDQTLIPSAGIDESNGDNRYVLWPKNSQETANWVRDYLANMLNLKRFGVIITDSTSFPLRQGVIGIALAHSGFRAINSYIGKPDVFGRPLKVSRSNVSGGLAAAAVVAMGEGNEQTPFCLIEDVDFVEFQDRKPTAKELAEVYTTLEDDVFAPFLTAVTWDKTGRKREP